MLLWFFTCFACPSYFGKLSTTKWKWRQIYWNKKNPGRKSLTITVMCYWFMFQYLWCTWCPWTGMAEFPFFSCCSFSYWEKYLITVLLFNGTHEHKLHSVLFSCDWTNGICAVLFKISVSFRTFVPERCTEVTVRRGVCLHPEWQSAFWRAWSLRRV